LAFPTTYWVKLRSTDPLGEATPRSAGAEVVGIFTNDS
jgi:hypothetical protein